MKEDLRSTIEAMHREFCTGTSTQPNLMACERIWLELVKAGYGSEDVQIFLLWVKAENQKQEDPRFRRRPHVPKMFGDIANFDADLTLARGWYRNCRQPSTPRETALEQLRPTVDPELAKARLNPARSAGEVLRRLLQSPTRPQM